MKLKIKENGFVVCSKIGDDMYQETFSNTFENSKEWIDRAIKYRKERDLDIPCYVIIQYFYTKY